MGKRSARSSCFKIISCGKTSTKDSVDLDDIDASSQNKGNDKRGWSFRKRSARHRVLSNTVVTNEPPSSSVNKETSDLIVISSEPQIQSSISDKTNDNIWTEDIQIPKLSNSSATKNDTVSVMVPETEKEKDDDIKCEPDPDETESESGFESESAIVVIQAAVRRFLAEKEVVKHKHVVKLQAAVRGHLVRTHAVGTLRCVQAIVKMQALVRARRNKGVKSSVIESRPTYVSVEKLLSNSLARQLMESTPRTKQINIKCDPLKSDSAWSWLERWMSVSSPEIIESQAPQHNQEKVDVVSYNVGEETKLSAEKDNLTIIDEGSDVKNPDELMENPDSSPDKPIDLITEPQIEINMITKNHVSETEPKPTIANSVLENEPESVLENPVLENEPKPNLENPVTEPEPGSVSENHVLETEPKPDLENPVAETEPGSICENDILKTEPKRSEKRVATDQADSESRKSVFGSRKASNPAFIAAQSRFEELTSKVNSIKSSSSFNSDDEPLKSSSSTNQGDVAGSGLTENISSSDPLKLDNEVGSSVNNIDDHEKVTTVTDVEPEEEYSVSDGGSKVVQTGGSECGTELSITSTLDSPDQSIEAENKKMVDEEDKVVDEIVDDTHDNNHNIDIDTAEKYNNNVVISQSDENPDSNVMVNSESKHEEIVPESKGTPSSEISTNSKKSKTNKKVSSQKRKSWSTTEKSPSRSSVDSGLRRSLEKLPKDSKSGKRRNSFGSPKPNHMDQESKDSNGNTSIPSYMQATESAKLKAIANSSPKSSPDLQDKEYNLKKRHSLPGAVNGRQGSPRIQRSMSQAIQSTKSNGNQERKWQR